MSGVNWQRESQKRRDETSGSGHCFTNPPSQLLSLESTYIIYCYCSYVTAYSVRLHYSVTGLLLQIHRSVSWASHKSQIKYASKTYELWTVKWVVRIVTNVCQTVSEKLYKRTDVSQLRTVSGAVPKDALNSQYKTVRLRRIHWITWSVFRARNTVTTQSASVARSNYSQ